MLRRTCPRGRGRNLVVARMYVIILPFNSFALILISPLVLDPTVPSVTADPKQDGK